MLINMLKKIGFQFSSNVILVDGTDIQLTGDLEKGSEAFITVDGIKNIVPDGIYQTKDGFDITIKDGKIIEIKETEKPEDVVEEKKEEVKPEVVAETKEELAAPVEDVPAEVKPVEDVPNKEKSPEEIMIENMALAMKAMEDEITAIKEQLKGLGKLETQLSKIEEVLEKTPTQPLNTKIENIENLSRGEMILRKIREK